MRGQFRRRETELLIWPHVVGQDKICGGSVSMDCMFVYPQNSYVETLVPSVIVFGDRALGRWISALIRRDKRACFLSAM